MLRAPANGVVLEKFKEVGEIAVPGGFAGSGELIRLANMDELRAEIDVNEIGSLEGRDRASPPRSCPTPTAIASIAPRW